MTMQIGTAFTDKRVFGSWFAGSSWDGWRAVLRAAFAEPITRTELAFFRSVAKREPPSQRVKEFWVVAGRRAGKDSIASGIAAHVAASFESAGRLRPGERALVACLAVDKAQAALVANYTRAFFTEIPSLAALVEREIADGLALSNGVDISIMATDFRSIRGRTVLCVIMDEVAYWRGDHTVSPDREVLRAIKPSMLTLPESMLVGISTAYRRDGLLYERWSKHFGKDSARTLVIQAESRALNPLLSQEEIDAAIAEDPEAAKADYLSEWRDAIAGYLSRDLLDAAVDEGVTHRPFDAKYAGSYTSFIDASSGQSDSFACAVAHLEDQTVVLDAVLEVPAPFNPEGACCQVAALLKGYGLNATMGDDHAKGWVQASLGRYGVRFESRPSEMTRSALYSETLPKFSSHQARLLDHRRLISQYAALERRLLPTGHERIDHPNRSGHHDDLANACAGALWRAGTSTNWIRNISPEFMRRLMAMPPSRQTFGNERGRDMTMRGRRFG
jgi:hypothetical protein